MRVGEWLQAYQNLAIHHMRMQKIMIARRITVLDNRVEKKSSITGIELFNNIYLVSMV